jgi:NAD-dependent oxidoreductase involved in siderophore biosynthesis
MLRNSLDVIYQHWKTSQALRENLPVLWDRGVFCAPSSMYDAMQPIQRSPEETLVWNTVYYPSYTHWSTLRMVERGDLRFSLSIDLLWHAETSKLQCKVEALQHTRRVFRMVNVNHPTWDTQWNMQVEEGLPFWKKTATDTLINRVVSVEGSLDVAQAVKRLHTEVTERQPLLSDCWGPLLTWKHSVYHIDEGAVILGPYDARLG